MTYREPILRRDEIHARGRIDGKELTAAIDGAMARIVRNIEKFAGAFPAPSSINNVYPPIGNIEWTNGFWTGMLWLAYHHNGAAEFRAAAETHLESYATRITHRIETDTHDLGFLYSLSCVAADKLTANAIARASALTAADLLLERYLPAAGIIQAWGDLSDPAQAGRMIIDCNLNLPLLYWASQTSGDVKYRRAADSHIAQAAKYLVRPDASTFHTFFMDPLSGAPREGRTHQGYSDTSCWARGQAWGIAGFPLVCRYNRDPGLLDVAARLANYFLNRLPDDLVCCWDLVFTDSRTQRDSSAAAIAACGLLELADQLPPSDPDRDTYGAAARAIVASLMASYACAPNEPGDGLLRHGVYHMPNNVGVDECCIWGDYFYLEALLRLAGPVELFW